KDRSAALPAGKQPDLCLWSDKDQGLFVTSTYYTGRLPAWVEQFNASKPMDRWFGKSWEHVRSDEELDYTRRSGPDERPGEGPGEGKKGAKQGVTFPHPMNGGATAPGKEYYACLYNSPFGNDLLLDLVKKAIDAEELGQDDVPDLLCVSFS